MHKLDVQDELLGTLIHSVVPLVQEMTHWDLRLPFLRYRAIPKERGYEEIYHGRIRGAGILLPESPARSLNERLIEYAVEESTLAAYEPSRQEILVISENTDDSNIDGLRLVLAHELVHRGQHVRYPLLFAQIDEMLRACWYANMLIGIAPRRELARLEAAMIVLESHAFFVQQYLAVTRFPLARIESRAAPLGMAIKVLGGKSSHYTLGLPRVAAATQAGRLDDLYTGLITQAD